MGGNYGAMMAQPNETGEEKLKNFNQKLDSGVAKALLGRASSSSAGLGV